MSKSEEKLLVYVVHKGEGKMISISENKGLDYIYHRVSKRWPEITRISTKIKYFATKITNDMVPFYLEDDVDIAAMINYAMIVNLVTLQLFLEPKLGDFSRVTPREINLGRGTNKRDCAASCGTDDFSRLQNNSSDTILGDDGTSHKMLKWYCHAVEKSNPGSIVVYETLPDSHKFHRLFICYAPCAYGFDGCRPLIFLEDIHIKDTCKGILLTASVMDPNDDFFPLAFAVVDLENEDNWEWFCWKLKNVFDSGPIERDEGFTFFSDKRLALVKAVHIVFPESNHTYLLKNLVDNFEKKVTSSYPEHIKKYWTSVLQKAAYALTLHEHNCHIARIVKAMPLAKEFFDKSNPICWANDYFPGDTNNIWAEICWNNLIKEARPMPILSMIDHIREQIMMIMTKRRDEARNMTGILCPKQEQKLLANRAASRFLKSVKIACKRYQVTDDKCIFNVDLDRLTCLCKAMRIHRIPCKHVCACIESSGESIYEYVDTYYRVEWYKSAYELNFNPIPTYVEDENTKTKKRAPILPLDSQSQPVRRRMVMRPL